MAQKSKGYLRLMRGNWRITSILIGCFTLFFQNCSGFNSLNSNTLESDFVFDSLLSVGQKTCNASANPEYRFSLLTKTEIAYVLEDLFFTEVTANPEILKKANEISEININSFNDLTFFSENNKGYLETEVYLIQLLDLAQMLFDQYSSGPSYKAGCDTLAGGCIAYYVNSVVAPLWRRPLVDEELANFDEIFKRPVTIKEKVNLLFVAAITSPQFYLKNYLELVRR